MAINNIISDLKLSTKKSITFLTTLLLTVYCTNSFAQTFTKVTNGPLVSTNRDSRSVNWVDLNNDGFVDCFISNGPAGGQNNTLYMNNGIGGFTAVISDPVVLDNKPSDGATFADMDNDGDLDGFVVNWYNINNLMYSNAGAGTFSQITTGTPVNDNGYSETASWGDFDNDGLVDLYVTNSAGIKKNFLYRNLGATTFTKVTTGAAVNDAFYSRSVNWTDMDNDGDVDIFVSNENNENENIYRNDGAGNFTALTSGPLLNDGANTMSSSWGDYDNDGDLDVFLANDGSNNALFRNDGNFNFTKIITDTVSKGVFNSFSSAWSDMDNDGDLDLFVTNAFGSPIKKVNLLYFNNGNGTFTRNSTGVLATDSSWSYGCAFGDYDNDGFEDLAVATTRFNGVDAPDFLYHNNGNSNKWLTVKLTGTLANKAAIGTIIKVKAVIGGVAVWQMREISAQSSYCGQNDLRAHFGLGDATQVDSIKVEWRPGTTETFTNIAVNQFINIIQGSGITGLNSYSGFDGIKLFPNPNDGNVSVTLSDDKLEPGDKIIVTNMQGEKINEITIQSPVNKLDFKLNVSIKPRPGVYTVSILKASGTIVKKVIIR